MSILQSLLLGLLQGLTEFLPISSSGHLVLGEHLLGLSIDPQDLQGFDILLHAATALALIVVYHKTWWKIICAPFKRDERHLTILLWLILATVPAAITGLAFSDIVALQFRSVQSVGYALLVTAMALLAARLLQRERGHRGVMHRDAFLMGLAQAFAIIPGLSRSGLTISAGQISGLLRKDALDFSFQMALPVILGATVLTVRDVQAGTTVLPALSVALAGFASAFVSSIFAIAFLRKFVASRSLAWFAVYLVPIGLLSVLL